MCHESNVAPRSAPIFEAPTFVSGLDDIAMMRKPVQQRGGHFGIEEDTWPFAKVEIGGDDDRGPLVEEADEMEQELAAGLGEGQIAELVEDDEVQACEEVGEPSLSAGTSFGLEAIDQIDGGEEPPA